ncbi:MAG: hydrogenase maturation peptidase HycI [Candidatus Riflebacteria bacterium]|nr:hydrogenase maturation peptidase HycI [Candidatus Riflebacteria bacterium]
MKNLFKTINRKIDSTSRIGILGIGSEIRLDDAVGCYIIRELELQLKQKQFNTAGISAVEIWYGGTAPENVTGDIKRFNPSHLFMIDAADIGCPPGTIKIIPAEDICGVSFTTHMLPLSVIVDYLKTFLDTEFTIIGIQPKVLGFGTTLSDEVAQAGKEVVSQITSLITNQ